MVRKPTRSELEELKREAESIIGDEPWVFLLRIAVSIFAGMIGAGLSERLGGPLQAGVFLLGITVVLALLWDDIKDWVEEYF